jgi:hypothetical protein
MSARVCVSLAKFFANPRTSFLKITNHVAHETFFRSLACYATAFFERQINFSVYAQDKKSTNCVSSNSSHLQQNSLLICHAAELDPILISRPPTLPPIHPPMRLNHTSANYVRFSSNRANTMTQCSLLGHALRQISLLKCKAADEENLQLRLSSTWKFVSAFPEASGPWV